MNVSSYSNEAVRAFSNIARDRVVSSLGILRLVDHTINFLAGLQKSVRGDTEIAYQFVEFILADDKGIFIDEDEVIVGQLKQTQLNFEKTITRFREKCNSAFEDPNLTQQNRQCIVEEYDNTIKAFSDFVDALKALTEAIIEHDKELSPFTEEENRIDAQIANEQLTEIEKNPDLIVRDTELEARLKKLLSNA